MYLHIKMICLVKGCHKLQRERETEKNNYRAKENLASANIVKTEFNANLYLVFPIS